MKPKQIVLLSNHSLLVAGVQKLLQDLNDLKVSIVAADAPEAAAKIKCLSPDAIILDSSDASMGEGIVTRLLEEHPKARVIALNLNQTGIEIFRMKRILQTDLEGLLEALQDDHHSASEFLDQRTEHFS